MAERDIDQEYFRKFGDFAPMYVNHSGDAEGMIKRALKSGKKIPQIPPLDNERDLS